MVIVMARSRAGFFPIRSAFPDLAAGRRPHCRFRGLLKLHACYGLPDCSPTIRGLCREVSIRPVTRTNRSPAIESNHQLFEWVLPPLVFSPLGAHTRPSAPPEHWGVQRKCRSSRTQLKSRVPVNASWPGSEIPSRYLARPRNRHRQLAINRDLPYSAFTTAISLGATVLYVVI